jgi:hypothetical protein
MGMLMRRLECLESGHQSLIAMVKTNTEETRASISTIWSAQDLSDEFGQEIQGAWQECKMQLAFTDEVKTER